MNGRRGFLSGITKMGAAGGAALLVPRAAQSDLRKVPGLSEHLEEVFIEESYEVSTEEVRRLLSRVKELEQVIRRGPAMFQGARGPSGPMGDVGMPGVQGEPGLTADQVQSIIWEQPQLSVQQNYDGQLEFLLPNGEMRCIEGTKSGMDIHAEKITSLNKEVRQLRDVVHYLLGTEQQHLDDLDIIY